MGMQKRQSCAEEVKESEILWSATDLHIKNKTTIVDIIYYITIGRDGPRWGPREPGPPGSNIFFLKLYIYIYRYNMFHLCN